MNDLQVFVSDAIEGFVEGKLTSIDNDDLIYDIKQRMQESLRYINEQLEEMEADIDSYIEQMNEPSDREVWNKEYERQREVEFI